eukprot:6176444-Pleurochrysis_carterae.AAC.1
MKKDEVFCMHRLSYAAHEWCKYYVRLSFENLTIPGSSGKQKIDEEPFSIIDVFLAKQTESVKVSSAMSESHDKTSLVQCIRFGRRNKRWVIDQSATRSRKTKLSCHRVFSLALHERSSSWHTVSVRRLEGSDLHACCVTE